MILGGVLLVKKMNDWGSGKIRRELYALIGVVLLLVMAYGGYIYYVTYSEKNMMTLLEKSFEDFTVESYVNSEESYFRRISSDSQSSRVSLSVSDIKSIMNAISSTNVQGISSAYDIQTEEDFLVYLDSAGSYDRPIRLFIGKESNADRYILYISSTKKTVADFYEVKSADLYKLIDELFANKS